MELNGKSALVTGAGSGIGKAIATAFANEGANVLVNDLTEAGRAVADDIGGTFIKADLSDREAVVALARHALEACGRIDILVNNAGFQHVAPVEEFPEETWVKMIQVMLIAAFQLTKHLAPAMKQNKWGRIINMSSILAQLSRPGTALYAATRASARVFARIAAQEFGPQGITVNSISPGPVEPGMFQDAPEAAKQHARAMSPFNRVGAPEDIADIVAFLVSDQARWITGQDIVAAGGAVS